MAKMINQGKRGSASRLNHIIRVAEKKNNVRLSEEAKRLLKVSVSELNLSDDAEYWDVINESVNKIVSRASASPGIRMHLASRFADRYIASGRHVSANAIMRSIHSLWCNIPPFCGPDSEDDNA